MKISKIIGFAILAISLCLSACSSGSDEPITPSPNPEVIKSEITIDSNIISNGLSFTSEKGEQSISFSTNENWTLSVASTTSGSTWCTASALSGIKGNTTVKFSVTENSDYENRSVSVTIKSGSVSKTFTISQKCSEAMLVTTDKYEISQEGDTIDIEVKANISYTMEISEEAKSWITESTSRGLTSYKHSLNIAMNEENEKREGEVYFKSGDKVETVKIYQSGEAILLLSENEYQVSDKGDTISVDIKSNVDFDVQMPEVDWIADEASSRGLSSHNLKYIISANEEYDSRTASIVFYDKNSDLKDTLKVVQAQKNAIIIAKNEYTIEAIGGDLSFEINTNVDFEVSASEDWIKQNTNSRGLETKPLNFSIEENASDEPREGVITISSGDLKQEIKILQKAKSIFSLSATKFEINSDGGNLKVEVTTNSEYTITMPEVDWLTENKDETETKAHSFTVSPNETYDSREAEIVFTHKYTNQNIKVCIVQAQKDAIIISQKTYDVKAEGETIEVKLSANLDFEVSMPNVDWISQTESRALKEHSIYFKVAKNDSWVINRKAEIKIINKESQISETILINQVSSKKAGYIDGTVTIFTAGTMKQLLDKDYLNITNLKVIGPINGDDVRCLRQMLGGDEFSDTEKGKLNTLDLSEALIIQGGEWYYEQSSWLQYYTANGIIGDYMFAECKLQEIVLPKSATFISDNAFRKCTLSSIDIPDNITSIVEYAFCGSSLTSITIGKNVTAIGSEAFFFTTSLTSVYIKDLSAWCNITFATGTSNPLRYGAKLYLNNEEVTELVIPEDIKEIKDNTFDGFISLKKVNIGNQITSIGKYAFSGCSSLSSVTIGNNVVSIGHSAFSNCSSLTSINIPDGVTAIEDYTFSHCSSLTSINIPNGVTTIGASTFMGCSSLTSINIPDGVTAIENYTFKDCSSLVSVTIGKGVTEIGFEAYRGCSSLPSINIPNSVISIDKYAFYECLNITTATIGKSVTSIGDNSFRDCPLTSIELPDALTEIGVNAFYGCPLTSVTIGKGITSIGNDAFGYCSSLIDFYIYAVTPPETSLHAFSWINDQATLHVPSGCKIEYQSLEPWKSDFKYIKEIE